RVCNIRSIMDRWNGRVAVVTGASVGIGAAICRALVEHGMKVVGAARDVQKIADLSSELSGQPGSLQAVECDLRHDKDVMRLFADVQHQYGRIDVCINNAGLSHNHSLLEGKPEEWREMLDVNVVALCLCTRETIRIMREANVDHGQIIHISSMSGHRVQQSAPGHFYACTKHAVKALTEGMRQELRDAKSNIRVAAISPGDVETEFLVRMTGDKAAAKKTYASMNHLQASDIAESVLYILQQPPHVQIHDVLIRPTEQQD
ncbi:unnamed protein product, partial [Meganyctiphanes norvegica]